MKIQDFNSWTLNESANSNNFTDLPVNKLVRIDTKFTNDYIDVLDKLLEMNDGSEEDSSIGDLVFRTVNNEEVFYPDSGEYSLLEWFYGISPDEETGELDMSELDSDYAIECFEEADKKYPIKEAIKNIDTFLKFEHEKSATIVFIYELCHQIHYKNENTGPEVLENSRWYTKSEIWDLVREFVNLSSTNFPKILDMLPKWYSDLPLLIQILPLDDVTLHKYRGTIAGKKFGL
jgi:hypothetical protein